jgi:hypothetical protein
MEWKRPSLTNPAQGFNTQPATSRPPAHGLQDAVFQTLAENCARATPGHPEASAANLRTGPSVLSPMPKGMRRGQATGVALRVGYG